VENETEPLKAFDRGIRSYVLRAGRMTDMQRAAFLRLAPEYAIPYDPETTLSSPAVFRDDHPLVVEIGFGMGVSTAAIAVALPGTNFIGIEVHTPGVGKLLSEIERNGLSNLRIVHHDAVEVLERMVKPGSVDGFHVFFPDPWPKKRHHKRRLLQYFFTCMLASRLKAGGYVYFVTDWSEYAESVLDVLTRTPGLRNASTGPGAPWAEREPWRPETKFEGHALRDGREIRELKFVKG